MSDHAKQSLSHVPVTIFASVMGLAGLGLAWHKAASQIAFAHEIANPILVMAGLAFLGCMAAYGLKALRHPAAIVAEWGHPIRSAFFSTIPIGLLLLASGLFPHAPQAALILWIIGACVQLGLTFRIFIKWIDHKQEIQHANPAWFIPIVGNIIVPILGAKLGQGDVSWFFFSIGMLFYMPMLGIILYRIIFHEPLPGRLAPTIFILIPPAAVGYLSYSGLIGGEDSFAQVLVNGGLFTTLLVLCLTPRLLRLPFSLPWWAYTFPLDAMSMASLGHAEYSHSPIWGQISIALLCVTTVMVAMVLTKTLHTMSKGELFLAE